MVISSNVDRILQEVVALSPGERRQFMTLLEMSHISVSNSGAEDLAEAALLRKGIIRKIPSRPTQEDIARDNSHVPFQIEGRPVSEVLIEERR